MVIVGSDRITAAGDVCNKVGTYLKALAAHDNGVPFYAALPLSTIDWSLDQGHDIPIEERSAMELTHVTGRTAAGAIETVRVVPEASPALNLGFDVTPARLVTALITERGICPATQAGLASTLSRSTGRDMSDPGEAGDEPDAGGDCRVPRTRASRLDPWHLRAMSACAAMSGGFSSVPRAWLTTPSNPTIFR